MNWDLPANKLLMQVHTSLELPVTHYGFPAMRLILERGRPRPHSLRSTLHRNQFALCAQSGRGRPRSQ